MRSPARRVSRAALLLGITAIVVAGCGGGTSSSTNPGTPMTQDAADDMAINAVATLTTLGGDVEGAASLASSGAPQPGAARLSRALWDTTFVRDSVTFHVTRTWYDVLNQTLPGPGPTASKLVWTSDASGHFTGEHDTAAVVHHGNLTVAGTQPLLVSADTLVLYGASLDTLENRFQSLDGLRIRHFHWESDLAIDNVNWAKGAPYPASGTVTLIANADRYVSNSNVTKDGHWHVVVVVTFNGTATPDVTINGTFHYHWNLITGVITRA